MPPFLRLGFATPPKTSIAIISGMGKATNFKFCMHIHRIDRNKSPLKISGKAAVGVLSDSRKLPGHPYIGRIARSSLRYLSFLLCPSCDVQEVSHSALDRSNWQKMVKHRTPGALMMTTTMMMMMMMFKQHKHPCLSERQILKLNETNTCLLT